MARTDMDADTAARLENFPGNSVNWDDFVNQALEENMAPLAHYHISRLKLDIPQNAAQSLKTRYLESAVRNMLLLGELGKVLKLFKDNGVQVIVLKGAALLGNVYKNIALRPMSDIDILIHKSDLETAVELISTLGYEDACEDISEDFAEQYRSELTMIRTGDSPVRIELHWKLLNFSYGTGDVEHIWETAVPAKIEGFDVPTLSPEYQIVYLSSHLAFHHHLTGLIWFCDIYEIVRNNGESINWKRVAWIGNATKQLLSVEVVLRYLKDNFGLDISDDVFLTLKTYKIGAFDKLFFKAATNQKLSSTVRSVYDLFEISGFFPRVKYVFRKIFPSRECMMRRHGLKHGYQVYPLYFKRLGIIFMDAIRGLFKILKKR